MSKISDFINRLLKATRSNDDFKTSEEWYEEVRGVAPMFVIMDPDGWDRTNYEFSFNEELISKQHFIMRVQHSTCLTYDTASAEAYKLWSEEINEL